MEKYVQAIHGKGSTTTLALIPMDLQSPAMDEGAEIPQPGSPMHRQPWRSLLGNRGFRFLGLATVGITGLWESRHGRGNHRFSGWVFSSLLTLRVQSWKKG